MLILFWLLFAKHLAFVSLFVSSLQLLIESASTFEIAHGPVEACTYDVCDKCLAASSNGSVPRKPMQAN